jgi:hypothetical protein
VVNLDSTPTAASTWQYMQVGSVVTVSGLMSVNPTAGGSAAARISLPVASNLANNGDCAGTASSPGVAGQVMAIRADAANDAAVLLWNAVDTTAQDTYVTFTYRVQ